MDQLWTPWRYAYITEKAHGERVGVPEKLAAWPGDHGCVFCNLLAATDYAIEHGMSRELSGKVTLNFQPEGLVCEWDMQLS